MNIRLFRTVFFGMCLSSIMLNASTGTIQWSTPSIQRLLSGGLVTQETITFTTSTDLNNPTIFIVPALQPYLTVASSLPSFIPAGTTQHLELMLYIPDSVPVGSQFEGTVHIRVGSQTIAPPLHVLLALSTIVYSNFGPQWTFDTNPLHGWTINGFISSSVGQQAISQQFTPSGSYIFSDAEVAVSSFQGLNSIVVYLQADAGGRPGAVLEQINVTGLTSGPTIIQAGSVLHTELHDGTPYWLTVVAGGPGVIAGWNWNSIGDSSSTTFASTQGGSPAGPWGIGLLSTRSAFQINGVPE